MKSELGKPVIIILMYVIIALLVMFLHSICESAGVSMTDDGNRVTFHHEKPSEIWVMVASDGDIKYMVWAGDAFEWTYKPSPTGQNSYPDATTYDIDHVIGMAGLSDGEVVKVCFVVDSQANGKLDDVSSRVCTTKTYSEDLRR